MTAGLILWPWFRHSAGGLSFILPEETVARGWALPFWTVIQIPVASGCADAGPLLSGYYQKTFAAPARRDHRRMLWCPCRVWVLG